MRSAAVGVPEIRRDLAHWLRPKTSQLDHIVINDKGDEGEIKLAIDTPAVSQYPVTVTFLRSICAVASGSLARGA